MTGVCREIFKSIHEGKWLSIEYKNQSEEITKYWIAIKELFPQTRKLKVDGMHLGLLSVQELSIHIDSILSASIVEGSYFSVNQSLIDDIRLNPQKYSELFSSIPNLRILNYLEECNKLDSTPYKTDYSLISYLDDDCLRDKSYTLSVEQFREIVQQFQIKAKTPQKNAQLKIKQLAINVLSIPTRHGLYVLAYTPLRLDVKNRMLTAEDEIVICKEYTIDGTKYSIRQFLDAENYYLLDNFAENSEEIKDCITRYAAQKTGVDDMPYLIAIGRDCLLDLNAEYKGILDMYELADKNAVSAPIKAFFGDMTQRPRRRKSFPLALLNRKVNLDQLLAINSAMRFPLTYVQGPPGTGKTNTILNTISTAFFNDRTILFASYNNHPIDSVFAALQKLTYHGKTIPFPVIRLGSNRKVEDALDVMRKLYKQTQNLKIFGNTLEKNKKSRIERAEQLTELLKRYDDIRDLAERKETIERLLDSRSHMHFQFELKSGQLDKVNKRLQEFGTVSTEDALALVEEDSEEFFKYLYYTSAQYIKRLDEPKNKELLDIILSSDKERVRKFNKYISDTENLGKFLRIFPIIATTCISAHKLGTPEPVFDMVIMDEASQCNTAVSLVPIIRGESLMLVGDPQQLSPVILLDSEDNNILRKRYNVSAEYDYIQNSIYKTYLACDSVSDEVLLSYHYRCHPKIIAFNNKKYYKNKLHVASIVDNDRPLVFHNVPESISSEKNTAPCEAEKIVTYIKENPDLKVGIITPFANQKTHITGLLRQNGLDDSLCGTVHAFQGDEKDVIIFSLALSNTTHQKTYDWLKNNKELINVATSRAREKLIIYASEADLARLHKPDSTDDIYELVEYVRSNGVTEVSEKATNSRALGIKPYSTQTEDAFLTNLNHALDNAFSGGQRCTIYKEVPISQVFQDNLSHIDLFYTGRFDFVVYERNGRQELPILAIELDGKEHVEDEVVRARDRKKESICKEHGFELIRVENSYARRYHYIKEILIDYFSSSKAT